MMMMMMMISWVNGWGFLPQVYHCIYAHEMSTEYGNLRNALLRQIVFKNLVMMLVNLNFI